MVQHIDSLLSSITQIIIGFGSVACVCCALFLGLKFKWFRAQFKVQDTSKNKKTSETVQGIGFKVKSNPEDFQRYKSISEFATPAYLTDNKIKATKSEEKSNTFAKIEKLTTNEESLVISSKKHETNATKEMKSEEIEEYKKETEIKKRTVSFAQENIEQIINPLPVEDNWQIRIVAEKPKVQIDNRNDDIYYEEIRLVNNINNNSNSNSMYSSEAASIFFESYDEKKQPPDSPPPPIPRKFLEDKDTISINSQTSA